MKAGEIFNDCHRCYRVLREWLKDSTGTVPSLNLENPSQGYQWRPEPGRACDYVLDFERIGRRALCRSEWKGRLKLFNVYFVRGADYRRAIRLVGVAESNVRLLVQGSETLAGRRNFRAPACFRPRNISWPARRSARKSNELPARARKSELQRAAFARNREQIADQGNAHVEGHQ